MNLLHRINSKLFVAGTAKSVIGLGVTTTIGYGTLYYSILIMALGLVALLLSGYDYLIALLFVLLYGAGQGLSDIVRGTLPLYLFGKDGYGKTTGGLNLFRLLITSMVPF